MFRGECLNSEKVVRLISFLNGLLVISESNQIDNGDVFPSTDRLAEASADRHPRRETHETSILHDSLRPAHLQLELNH